MNTYNYSDSLSKALELMQNKTSTLEKRICFAPPKPVQTQASDSKLTHEELIKRFGILAYAKY